jgi:AraC family transcriptional activator of pobA
LIEARLMREARRQLAYTSLPVSTIAYTLGFGDPAYFSRVFGRVEGLSPRAFRERLVAGAPPRNAR